MTRVDLTESPDGLTVVYDRRRVAVTTAATGETVTVDYAPIPMEAPAGLVCVDPSKLPKVAAYGVTGGVVKVGWSTVNPEPGVFDWSAVDAILDAHPGCEFTLRIQAGGTTPGWVKTATGCLTLRNAARSLTVETAKWWQPAARDAWQAMIQAAGARYGADPRIVMVSADLPMVVYSEPYILGGDKASGVALYRAGLTQAVQVDTIAWCVDVTAEAFPTTLVELAIHSDLQFPTATGVGYSWPVGRALALDLAIRHGAHLLLSDYGLGVGDTLAAHTPTGTLLTEPDVYAWLYLRARSDGPEGGPVGFQLTPKGHTTPADYAQMAGNAVDLGAQECETSGWGSMTPANVTRLDAALKANQF